MGSGGRDRSPRWPTVCPSVPGVAERSFPSGGAGSAGRRVASWQSGRSRHWTCSPGNGGRYEGRGDRCGGVGRRRVGGCDVGVLASPAAGDVSGGVARGAFGLAAAGESMSPQSLPRACIVAGCPGRATEHGRCEVHQVPEVYGESQPVYHLAKHRHWRRHVLRLHPICPGWPEGVHAGVIVETVVADHIVPLSEGGGWHVSNGRGLCLACHSKRHAAERRRR